MLLRNATYRIFRLRRVVLLCLIALLAGAVAGIWLADGTGPFTQPLVIAAVLVVVGALHLALLLRWPTNTIAPLAYSIVVGVLLAFLVPFAGYVEQNPEAFSAAVGISIVFGPFVWWLGAPMMGTLILLPLDYISIKNYVRQQTWRMNMTPAAAFDHFALRPNRTTFLARNGPVQWDGFWDELSTDMIPSPKSGKLTPQVVSVRIKEMESTSLSQALLVLLPSPKPSDDDRPLHSVIIHLSVTAAADGARITKISSIDHAKLCGVFINWLADTAGDVLTAYCDHLAGVPARAICRLPKDTLDATVSRFFHTDNKPIV